MTPIYSTRNDLALVDGEFDYIVLKEDDVEDVLCSLSGVMFRSSTNDHRKGIIVRYAPRHEIHALLSGFHTRNKQFSTYVQDYLRASIEHITT